ncbi:MAG: TerB family tellurite resistance protein [Patescibacteria group bacterium]
MDLFNQLKGEGETALSPKGALALAAMTVIGVDGSIDEGEIEALKRMLRGDGEVLLEATRMYKDKSVTECVEMVGNTLDDKQQVAAIINLLDLAMTDGILTGSEEKLLTLFVACFQIPEEVMRNLIDVIAMKNNFSVFDD